MTGITSKSSIVVRKQMTDGGYLIKLIQNLEFDVDYDYAWEVHSIAPDGYRTVSDESSERRRCEQTFKLLTEMEPLNHVSAVYEYNNGADLRFYVREGLSGVYSTFTGNNSNDLKYEQVSLAR